MKLSIVVAQVIEKLNYTIIEKWLINIGKGKRKK